MNTTEQIGSLIAELRIEKGLKQNQLSAMLNMSQGNLSNYEHGVYGPALDALCNLADFFNVSTDYLLGRTSYRCPPEAFRENLTSHYTMSHIINILLDLDTRSQDAAVKYMEFLRSTKPATAEKPGKHISRKAAAHREKADQNCSLFP